MVSLATIKVPEYIQEKTGVVVEVVVTETALAVLVNVNQSRVQVAEVL